MGRLEFTLPRNYEKPGERPPTTLMLRGQHSPADPLVSDFQPPNSETKKCLVFKPLSF